MQEHLPATLEQLGRRAAEEVAGVEAVRHVEVEAGVDAFDRPAYTFSFLIDQERAQERIGLIRIRLSQRLHDELAALGDAHLATIRILGRADGEPRQGA